MARCPNKNTAEYKALKEVFKTEIITNNVINNWQDLNNVDTFPSVIQAQDMLRNQRLAMNLKKRQFGESLLNNLRRERIGHSYKNKFYINNSNPNTGLFDELFLSKNIKRLNRYLDVNNIPSNRITLERTAKTYRLTVNDDLFTTNDMLESSRSWDTPRARSIVKHLRRMFPQVNIEMLSVAEAKEMYKSMPQWKKSNTPFDKVNSFYVDGVAYLIKGRVTDEIAIEEMLHPFVDAIKADNEDLFNSLLKEANSNFPEMVQEIADSYNLDRRFSQLDRDLEIVTQALSRHFNNQYEKEGGPSRGFLNKIKEVIQWFANIIKNFNEYLTGRPLDVSSINDTATLTDIAKLLNTEGIQFKLESRVNGKIRYSLSPEKKKALDIQRNSANEIQKQVLNKLFNVVESSKEEFDSLSANLNDTSNPSIVILNEKDHTYYNITTGEVYTSVTTAIKGRLKNQEDVQLNLDVGNDVDALLDSVIAGESPAEAQSKLSILTPEMAEQVYAQLETTLDMIMPEGSIALSQVVLFDENTSLAGTADLLIIDRNGFIRIVDLKTSKNSIKSRYVTDKITGRSEFKKYDKSWDIVPSDQDVIKDLQDNNVKKENGKKYSKEQIENRKKELSPLLYEKAGVEKLSTREQHNLQVNLYRRMVENMGYKVFQGEGASTTIHFVADITGKGKDQKFNGNIKPDGRIDHPPSENLIYVDKLIPENLDNIEKDKLESAVKNAEDQILDAEQLAVDSEQEADTVDAQQYPEYNTILTALENYRLGLVDRRKALDQVKKSIYSDRTKKEQREQIASHLAYIGIAISEGPIAQSKAYSSLLRDALKEIRKFSAYVQDPSNFGKTEYITYVLNFDRFAKTFVGLYSIEQSNELNATQRSLVLSLQLELNKLTGGDKKGEGIINQAISDYVKETIRTRSSNEFGVDGSAFTKEDLDMVMEMARDINGTELQTRDLDTSPDVLLGVMAKIYKAKKQELLDRVAETKTRVTVAAEKLLKLSPTNDKEKIYDFMHESDGRYVKPIGQQYYDLEESLGAVLTDNDGQPYYYRDISNLDDASQEDIDYNIDLANKKRAYSDFMAGEMKNSANELVDGEYHRYTDEFKQARNKFEYWSPGSDKSRRGRWSRKAGNSDKDYALYEAKYYDMKPVTFAERNALGDATGVIVKDQIFRAVKPEFREVRLTTRSGQDMASAKYRSIMNPTNALEQAQKEFYEMYIDVYENYLLKKLPVGELTKMVGKTPLVKNNLIDDLKNKPTIVSKLYAKTIGSNAWNMFKKTSSQRGVVTDENGNLISSLPIYYTGRPRIDGEIEVVDKQITALQDKKRKGLIGPDAYDKEMAILNGKMERLRSQPSAGQISRDLGSSLLKFAAMAENYEVMGTIEDTLNAFLNVIEKREYQPADTSIETGTFIDNAFKKRGIIKGKDSNVLKRAKKWMSMIYYQDDMMTKGAADKIADGLIQLSSLSYVAFNPFGNFNNYVIGRINNNIEMLGGRFYSRKAYQRATYEFNKRAIPDIVQRTSYVVGDLGDVLTLGLVPGLQKSTYDPQKPNSKYEAFVDLFRMMDSMSDIREQSSSTSEGKSWFQKATEWGYILQDAAEYNVQTKVGMALLMDTFIKNTETNEVLSLYDAFDYDANTHKNVLKDGFTMIVDKNGNNLREYSDEFRYELRNQIREVNKQIHGNYAKEDRVVMQSTTIGKLAFQFHKWVAPAIRARYQREYFDQNLGWMEGRYISAWKFLLYTKEQIAKGNMEFSKYNKGFLESYGYTGKGGNIDQRATNKLFGFYRTMGEIGIILSTLVLSEILGSLLAGEDDDSDTMKRFKNVARYQADRSFKELIMFLPVPGGFEQQYQMFKSPIAATRTLGELGEALSLTIRTPMAYLYYSDDEFRSNSSFVYQQKPRKGELKVYKNWKDVLPIIYSVQKWDAYLKLNNFYIK